jgi:hypothetical protein
LRFNSGRSCFQKQPSGDGDGLPNPSRRRRKASLPSSSQISVVSRIAIHAATVTCVRFLAVQKRRLCASQKKNRYFPFCGYGLRLTQSQKLVWLETVSMWRTILSSMLIGTTLIGPGFCCCSLGLVQLAGAEAADDCCCGSSSESNPCAPFGDDSGHQCPCKKFRQFSSSNSDNERLVLPSETRNRLTSIIVFDSVPTTVWSFEVAGLNVTGSPCCAFPRLDGQGILRAKQALRC